MSDSEVFQCQYCGGFAPLSKAVIAWAEDWQSDENKTVFTMAVACTPSCAERMSDLRVAR